jgi:hypothetical protein
LLGFSSVLVAGERNQLYLLLQAAAQITGSQHPILAIDRANRAQASTRPELSFEMLDIVFKFVHAFFETEHVVAVWVINAFQGLGEPRNLGPQLS